MANSTYDVLLRFISDQASKQKAEQDVDALNKKLGETGEKASQVSKGVNEWTKSLKEAERLSKKFGDEFTKRYEAAIASGKSLEEAIAGVRKELEKTGEPPKGKSVAEQIRQANVEARLLRREAAAIVDGFEKVRLAQLKAFGSRLGGASRTGLIASGALFGGVLAEANRFAQDAEDTGKATQATREWTAATKELAQARERVDTVLLRESLPLLQQAAKVATQASQFVADNPQIVRAALETGKVVAGLSILGTLVSKGITLYADVKALTLGSQELQAANLQNQAAEKQLQAARLQAGIIDTGTSNTPKGPSGAAARAIQIAGAVTLVATSVLLGAEIGNSLGNAIARAIDPQAKDQSLGETVFRGGIRPIEAIIQKQQEVYKGFLKMLSPFEAGDKNIDRVFGKAGELLQTTDQFFQKMLLGIDDVTKKADDLNQALTGLRGSAHETEIVSAFEQWQEDDARIVQEAADRRIEIVRDAENRIAQATAQFASRATSINTAADRRAAELTTNFLQANAQAEADYQAQRAQTIEDGNQEIRDIQEAHQERLRKMADDHNERVEDLTSARDALGLAKENRRFSQEVAEENRSTRLEIAKRRADLAERLADLARQNEAERAQRLAQYQQALAENEAQRQEQLKEAAAAFAEEQRQIREQRAQQLRELQEGLNAERLRRREVFIEQIRDLDAALLGERNLRNLRYAEMLADADRFLTEYRARLASLGTATATPPTGFAVGGYASGLVRTGEQGVEYVLSNRTTRAAENIIGGRLTQEAVLNALARGGSSSSRTINISDHSRFDGRISAREVRAIKQATVAEIARELG